MASDVAPGEVVLAFCKSCHKVAEHTVVALRASRPYKVQCRTCDEAHPYRASAPAPRKRAPTSGHSWALPPSGVNYDDLMAGRDPAQAVSYAMTEQFANSDLIAHSTFGLGLVTRVLLNRKIEVLFADGMKMLAHER